MTVTLLWVRATARRGLWSLLFVGLVSGVGTAVVATALLGAARTSSAVDRAVAAFDPPDLQVQSEGPGLEADLEGLDGVRAVLPMAMYIGGVEGVSADVALTVSDPVLGQQLNRVTLRKGRLPSASSTDEALLTTALAASLGVGVGDTFEYQSVSPEQLVAFNSPAGPGDAELPPGPLLTLRVVGIGDSLLSQLDRTLGSASMGQAFSDRYANEAGHFGSPRGLGDMAFVWLEDRDGYARFVEQARSVRSDISSRQLADFVAPAERTGDVMASGALVFAVAATGALVCAIGALLLRHLARARQDHAILALLGAGVRSLVGLRVGETLPAGVTSGVVAVVGCTLLARLTPFGSVARDVDPAAGAVPAILVLLLVFVAAVAVVAAVSALAEGITLARARRPARAKPAAAWDRTTPPSLATGMRFALARGSGPRLASGRAVLVAGAVAVAGVSAGVAFAGNLDDLAESPARWGWTWSVKLDVFEDARRQALELADHPDVAGVAFVHNAQGRLGGLEGWVESWETLGGSLAPALVEGRLPASPDEVVVSTSLVRALGLGVGDRLVAETADGTTELAIVGEATVFPLDGSALATPAAIVTPEGMERVALSEGSDYVMVSAVEGVSAEALHAELTGVIGEEAMTPTAYALADAPVEVDNAVQLRSVGLLLAVFFGAVGAAVVGAGITAGAGRRRGELAVLRVLGLTPGQTRAVIAWQAVFVAAVGLAAGIPVGIVAGRLVSSRVSLNAYVSAGSFLQPLMVPALVGLTVGLALVLAVWPAHRAARACVAATLRTE